MKPISSTTVSSFEFDLEYLSQNYEIWEVSYGNLNKEETDRRLKTLARDIYRTGTALALSRDGKNRRYVVLTKHLGNFSFASKDTSTRKLDLTATPHWLLAGLLLKALPSVLNQTDNKRFEADGLYYVIGNPKKLPHNLGQQLVTVNVDLSWSKSLKKHYLRAGVQTFTPYHYFEDRYDNVPASIQKLPRFELDIILGGVVKKQEGDYVKRSTHKKARTRVPMLDFRFDSIEKFVDSRVGAIGQTIEDLDTAYSGAFKIHLQQYAGIEHKKYNDKEIREHYSGIYETLKSEPINIINSTDSDIAGKLLYSSLSRDGYHVGFSDQANDHLNILIVNPPEHYQSKDIDPYHLLRRDNPGKLFQSCYPSSLIQNGDTLSSHVKDVLLKELLIKMELQKGKLSANYPLINEDAVFLFPIEPENKFKLKRDAQWELGKATFKGNDIHCELATQELLDDIKLDLTEEAINQVFVGMERSPMIYWPATGDYAVFSDTGAVALPEYQIMKQWLSEIRETRNTEIPASLVQDFILEHRTSKVSDSLQTLVSENPSEETVSAEELSMISFLSKEGKAFYSWMAEKGFRIKAPFRSSEYGLLDATLGLFIDKENNVYYAASKGGAQTKIENFAHFYHVNTSLEQLPDWVWATLDVVHIRHKQPTVMPYPFKHLREFGKKIRFESKLDKMDSAAVC
jgi:hypothetical protein